MKRAIANNEPEAVETFFTDLEFRHRLKLARMYAGYDDPRAFSHAAGISASTYYQYESGRSKSVQKQAMLDKISKATGLSAEWLETGKGYPIANKPESYDALDELAKKAQLKPYEELDGELLQLILQQLLASPHKSKLSGDSIANIAVKAYQKLNRMRLSTATKLSMVTTILPLVLELYHSN